MLGRPDERHRARQVTEPGLEVLEAQCDAGARVEPGAVVGDPDDNRRPGRPQRVGDHVDRGRHRRGRVICVGRGREDHEHGARPCDRRGHLVGVAEIGDGDLATRPLEPAGPGRVADHRPHPGVRPAHHTRGRTADLPVAPKTVIGPAGGPADVSIGRFSQGEAEAARCPCSQAGIDISQSSIV
ncbi:MAG TPA: hypothetical protein VHW26_11555 [Solirubrobacteraceae bacterium]|nr:hypothetical protein [Solirubrobacteraceae bacterium]